MMSQCSVSTLRLPKIELVMLLLSMMTVVSGEQARGRHGGRDGDDDDDDGGSSGHGGPQLEAKLDQGGLEDSLKSGGAEGLAGMLAAMGAMHHDTQLIPVTKDANGNAMYNFGALMTTAPPETTTTLQIVTAAVTAPPTTTNFGASLLKSASADVVSSTPQAVASVKGALVQGLRGSVKATAASVAGQAGPPLATQALVAQEQSETLRHGLAAIRDRVNSLMDESNDVLFGSQVSLHTQAAVALAPDTQGQQQQFADMLRRVSALEGEHAKLEKQVHNQSDQIQRLEKEETTEKQQLAIAGQNNTVLSADASDVKKQLVELQQQSKQLQDDDKQSKDQLANMEKQNKQLQAVLTASSVQKHQKASASHKMKHRKPSRRKAAGQHKAKHQE